MPIVFKEKVEYFNDSYVPGTYDRHQILKRLCNDYSHGLIDVDYHPEGMNIVFCFVINNCQDYDCCQRLDRGCHCTSPYQVLLLPSHVEP